jgi:rhamnose transport system substrate-binding protein
MTLPQQLKPARIRRAGAAVAVAAALTLAACGTTKSSQNAAASQGSAANANPAAATKSGLKIAFLPKEVNNAYFTAATDGGQQAVRQLGDSSIVLGPSNVSSSAQVPYIDSLIVQHVNAIAISASDANAVVPSLQRAERVGIKVVTWDSDTAPSGRNLFINDADPQVVGSGLVQLMAKQLGYRGQIAILAATPTALNQIEWVQAMKRELAKPAYKNMQLVTVVYGQDDDQISYQKTQGLIQAYPQLKGIIAPTSAGIAAAARYLDSSPYKGRIALTGLGEPNQMRKFVDDGTVQSFELWNVPDLGYAAAYAASALASGKITGAPGQTFQAGKLGTLKIGPGGQVIPGAPIVFTKANINNYSF